MSKTKSQEVPYSTEQIKAMRSASEKYGLDKQFVGSYGLPILARAAGIKSAMGTGKVLIKLGFLKQLAPDGSDYDQSAVHPCVSFKVVSEKNFDSSLNDSKRDEHLPIDFSQALFGMKLGPSESEKQIKKVNDAKENADESEVFIAKEEAYSSSSYMNDLDEMRLKMQKMRESIDLISKDFNKQLDEKDQTIQARDYQISELKSMISELQSNQQRDAWLDENFGSPQSWSNRVQELISDQEDAEYHHYLKLMEVETKIQNEIYEKDNLKRIIDQKDRLLESKSADIDSIRCALQFQQERHALEMSRMFQQSDSFSKTEITLMIEGGEKHLPFFSWKRPFGSSTDMEELGI